MTLMAHHLAPAAAVGFPTTEILLQKTLVVVNGKDLISRTVQDSTTTGTGIYIDGDQARSLKAMNVDAFTQYNQGGSWCCCY